MSGVSATSARIGSASASMRSDRLSPPWGLGSTEPVRRHSSYHLIAADAATPKRSAAARRLMPASTAPTTRKRRSRSSGLVMAAGLLPPAATLNQNSTTLGIPLDSVRAEYALDDGRAPHRAADAARLARRRSRRVRRPDGRSRRDGISASGRQSRRQ